MKTYIVILILFLTSSFIFYLCDMKHAALGIAAAGLVVVFPLFFRAFKKSAPAQFAPVSHHKREAA